MGVTRLNGAKDYLELLETKGKTAYFTGGTVRDIILYSNASDYDIATSNLPEETAKILDKAGLKTDLSAVEFGCVSTYGSEIMPPVQITTFRREIEYIGRKPVCEFIDDIYEDSLRRDFTINALYMDKEGNILDFHQGLQDLQKKVIRFIGDPVSRIKQDPLRIMRLFRFACTLGFKIEYESEKAVKENMNLLSSLSPERIRQELEKIIEHSDKECLELLNEFKLFETLFEVPMHPYKNEADLEGFIVHLINECKASYELVIGRIRLTKKEKNKIREKCDVHSKG